MSSGRLARLALAFGFLTFAAASAEAGQPQGSTVGSLVWNDVDNDGVRDAGEAGLAAVAIELRSGDGAALIDSTVTLGDGTFQFTGVAAGEYRLRIPASEFNPAGVLRDYRSSTGPLPTLAYEPAPDPDTDATDSDDNGTESSLLLGLGGYIESQPFTVDGVANRLDVDFGVNKLPQIDLTVTNTDGVATYSAGGTLNYTVVVTDLGPADAVGMTVNAARPPQIVSWTWTCAPGTPAAYNCTGDATNPATFTDQLDLPQLASVTYSVTAQVAAGPTGDLTHQVFVVPPSGMSDLTPGDNIANDVDALLAADLSITKSAGSSAAVIGSPVDFTLVVVNAGPGAATGVVATDTLPAGLAFVSSDCGAVSTPPSVTWNVGALAAGGNATCVVTATITATGPKTNVASVTGVEPDPTPSSNQASAAVFGQSVAEVPTLGPGGLVLLGLCLAALAAVRLRSS